jgi:uncharacterized protein with NRDE domain
MCLIAWNWQPDTAQPLLLIGNRDEFYDRPTQPLHGWADGQTLAGQDERAGGTWLGLNRRGRMAALTNYRSGVPQATESASRGELVTQFLNSALSAHDFLQTLAGQVQRYKPFNLLVFDGQALMGLESRTARVLPMQPGVGAVSNADFHTPWPKLRVLREGLMRGLAQGQTDDAALRALLAQRALADDADLPHTGIPLARERALSAAFVLTPDYGTRACSILRLGAAQAEFVEDTFEAGVLSGTQRRVVDF